MLASKCLLGSTHRITDRPAQIRRAYLCRCVRAICFYSGGKPQWFVFIVVRARKKPCCYLDLYNSLNHSQFRNIKRKWLNVEQRSQNVVFYIERFTVYALPSKRV